VFDGVGGAVTLDLWSDGYRKINYFSVKTHCIANGKLEDRFMHKRIAQ